MILDRGAAAASGGRAGRRVCAGRGGGGRSPSQTRAASDQQRGRRDQDRDRDDDQGGQRDEEAERAGAAALAAAGAELTTSLTTRQAKTAPSRQKKAPGERADVGGAGEQEADDERDHAGQDRHPAAGRAVRAGGAGEHPDRDADAELEADAGERSHAENLTPPAASAPIRHTIPDARAAPPAPRPRQHARPGALRRPLRRADPGDALLGDAGPDGGHRAARGDLARRRPARHLDLPAAEPSPRR